MRLLLIHQAFVSPTEAGGTRHYELSKRFVDAGHDFTIVASDLSYLSGQKTVADGESREQEFDGVQVRRAWTYSSYHKSFAWRIVSFLSFMVSSAWQAMKVKDVDVVMGTSPPIFQALSAWVVSVLKWKPFLLEVRDLWPDFAVEMGLLKSPVLIWVAKRLEMFLYRRADHLIVNSPAYREYLIGLGLPESKISFVANGVDTAMFADDDNAAALRAEFGLEEKYIVTYAGAIGIANDIDTVLDAASLTCEHPSMHYLIVGDGKERPRLQERAEREQLTNVTFIGSRPKSDMPRLLAMTDACLATLKDIPMFRTTYPNKVFDYMAASRPTVLGIDGVVRDVVERANGGIPFSPGDARALAAAVSELADHPEWGQHMGQSARRYVCEHFDRDKQAVEFRKIVETVAASKQPTAAVALVAPSEEGGQRFVSVIGAGGHAKVVISTLRAAGFDVTAVYDDNPAQEGRDVLGVPVVGPTAELNRGTRRAAAVIAIGDPNIRRKIAESLDVDWQTVVHPAAVVDPTATLGAGTVVFAEAVVQPHAKIGEHCIINTSASVDHDCCLGDFSAINPGAHLAGNVSVGEGTTIGIGASVIQGVTIGPHSFIGGGAIVIHDIQDHVTAVGCPARILEQPNTQRRAA